MRSGTLIRRRQLARILRELRQKSGLTAGLLQTAEYARALFESSMHVGSRAVRENDVEVRMIRQGRLRAPENPLTLVAVIEESALRRVLGGPQAFLAGVRAGEFDS